MYQPIDSFPSRVPARRPQPWLTGLCLCALLVLTGSAVAQDNDDDGVLPSPTANGGAWPGTAGGVVGVSTTIEASEAMPSVARVRAEAVAGDTTLEEDVDENEAIFVAEPGTAIAEPTTDGYLLQGRGQLVAAETVSLTLEKAAEALAGTLILLLDDGSASLDALLAGTAQPDQVVVVGDVTAVSLQGFQSLVTSHADDLPGVHATLVLVSVDASGVLHLSAVRAATEGGALEVVTE